MAAVVAGVALPAGAGADQRLELRAGPGETGYVTLDLHWRAGAVATISEQANGASEPVASVTLATDDTRISRAVPWRCDRRVRHFTVSSTTASGAPVSASAELRTPSCAHRLLLAVRPRRVRPGQGVKVRVADRWHRGDLRPTLCTTPPGGPRDCRRVATGERTVFRARRAGTWVVLARTPWQRVAHAVSARHRGGRLTLLATGDSMIQIVDSFLDSRLRARGVRVRHDARISTGISKPGMLDWQALARRQARRLRPDVTVVFLGANDGFPMAGAACCGQPWIAEYARRAGRMVRAYARHGAGRVYWALLPAASHGFFREMFPAVNAAIRRAAAAQPRAVRVIDLARIFTPGGRFRESMRVHGRLTRVRQGDGVHLSTAGASVAASVLIRTLRAERIAR